MGEPEVIFWPFEALQIPKAVLFCVRDHSADYLGTAARPGN